MCIYHFQELYNVFKHFLILACHVPEPSDKPRKIVFDVVLYYRLTAAIYKPVYLHDVRRDQAMADAVFCECVGYFLHVHRLTSTHPTSAMISNTILSTIVVPIRLANLSFA